MQQMNDVYAFIDFRNQTHATIEGLLRIDTRDYPEVAVREALLNLLVHRDYSFSASALISMYEDRIEFVSIGGLVPGDRAGGCDGGNFYMQESGFGQCFLSFTVD